MGCTECYTSGMESYRDPAEGYICSSGSLLWLFHCCQPTLTLAPAGDGCWLQQPRCVLTCSIMLGKKYKNHKKHNSCSKSYILKLPGIQMGWLSQESCTPSQIDDVGHHLCQFETARQITISDDAFEPIFDVIFQKRKKIPHHHLQENMGEPLTQNPAVLKRSSAVPSRSTPATKQPERRRPTSFRPSQPPPEPAMKRQTGGCHLDVP